MNVVLALDSTMASKEAISALDRALDAREDWSIVSPRHLSTAAEEVDIPLLLLVDGMGDRALANIRALLRRGHVPLFVVTNTESTPDSCWNALHCGAEDVIYEPNPEDAIRNVLARIERHVRIEQLLRSPIVRNHFLGTSQTWRRTLRQVVEAAHFSASPILLLGETGTGKELTARLVHTLDGRRNKGELVLVDCSTLSPTLSGSEFFGHERGAFTNALSRREGAFALADGGTLFLDEVAELSPSMQAELLRVVQERTYKPIGSNTWKRTNFRLVCATHVNLEEAVARGRFRADLYHRVAGWSVVLPPLRNRRSDIPALAESFLADHGNRVLLSDPLRTFLRNREYPGNIRELRQVMARIAARYTGPGRVSLGCLPPAERLRRNESEQTPHRVHDETELLTALVSQCMDRGLGLKDLTQLVADHAVSVALADTSDQDEASRRLGISKRALQMRISQRRKK